MWEYLYYFLFQVVCLCMLYSDPEICGFAQVKAHSHLSTSALHISYLGSTCTAQLLQHSIKGMTYLLKIPLTFYLWLRQIQNYLPDV